MTIREYRDKLLKEAHKKGREERSKKGQSKIKRHNKAKVEQKIETIWIQRGPGRNWTAMVETKEGAYKKEFHYKKDANQWMRNVIDNPVLITRMEQVAEIY